MPRRRIIRPGQSRRDLPDNALGLPLHDFGARIAAPPAPLLVARHTHTAEQAERVEQLALQLAELEAEHGPEEAADRYLDCPVEVRRDRIAAAVTVALVCDASPELLAARDGHLPPNRTARRMTALERGALRIGTWGWPLRAINVALAEAGAVVGQHINLQPDDLQQIDGTWHAPLPKNRGVTERTVALPRWVNPLAEQAVAEARRESRRLCLITDPASRSRGRRNVTSTLDRALGVAGAAVTAGSIRRTSGHIAYDNGGWPAAIAALGVTTEEAARRLLSS